MSLTSDLSMNRLLFGFSPVDYLAFWCLSISFPPSALPVLFPPFVFQLQYPALGNDTHNHTLGIDTSASCGVSLSPRISATQLTATRTALILLSALISLGGGCPFLTMFSYFPFYLVFLIQPFASAAMGISE